MKNVQNVKKQKPSPVSTGHLQACWKTVLCYCFALFLLAATLSSQAQSQGQLLLIPNSAESALVTVPSVGCARLGSVAVSKKSTIQ